MVIVHGVNMVHKRPPYRPSAVGFDATADIVIATLALGAVTALAETRLHRRG